ncbi:hypothetical protein BP5796_02018 [Coleophoma crateriformis]|uniref:Transcription factor domain-containing protein n=1 Tax=Coleophoma crateriformis TaxID=565419 RepID=A0A3D8T262_9HELO|nr:hypothetical protein BP5796_02018 [Coleophoma crateriformis]
MANITCNAVDVASDFIFLNENEYVGGQRKRPRGPNVNKSAGTRDISQAALMRPTNRPNISLPPVLAPLLNDLALAYYSHYYVEVPRSLPEIIAGHMKYSRADICYTHPESILSLAIFAVSYATFGRAQKNSVALAAAASQYSKALVKTNAALMHTSEATNDEVFLAAMLLSFYENSVMDNTSLFSGQDIQATASRSFAHHDGAMAMLKMRRQLKDRTESSMELDKLVRRQLIRSLILRNLPVPSWLRDGSQYGETDFALKLDRCTIIVAKIRHQAASFSGELASPFAPGSPYELANIQSLLAEAQALDNCLIAWARELPIESLYTTHTLQESGISEKDSRIFNSTVHIYPNVGHAGMWNRYRALRLIVNDIILKALSSLVRFPGFDAASQLIATKLKIEKVANAFCASVPYMLELFEIQQSGDNDMALAIKAPASLKISVRGTTASLLCWPLTIATTVSGIPGSQQRYLRDRLLDVSEIVDDGVLERIAASFSPSCCSANIQEVSP